MSEFKHTPWAYRALGEANQYAIRNESKGQWVMRVQINGEYLTAEQERVIALICAAPELLAALEKTSTCLQGWIEIASPEDLRDYDAEALTEALSAIAKAKGGAG